MATRNRRYCGPIAPLFLTPLAIVLAWPSAMAQPSSHLKGAAKIRDIDTFRDRIKAGDERLRDCIASVRIFAANEIFEDRAYTIDANCLIFPANAKITVKPGASLKATAKKI